MLNEWIKSIYGKTLEEDITLAKFLSELKVSKNDRVVIYDDSDNMVFDSDESELFYYYEFWEMLEETVCRVSDMTKNGKEVFLFLCAHESIKNIDFLKFLCYIII